MCSYCGCQAIEIIGRFTAEHEDIVNGLGDLRRSVASGDEADIASSAAALAGMLGPHTASEERSLFAELRLDVGERVWASVKATEVRAHPA